MKRLLSFVWCALFMSCTYAGPTYVAEPAEVAVNDELAERLQLWADVAGPSVQINDPNGGNGSGVVVSSNADRALVLTAAHVVVDEAGAFRDVFVTEFGHGADPAKVVRVDLSHDLALLRTAARWNHPAELYRLDAHATLGWGSRVVAYGHPAGIEEGILTDGRITAVDAGGYLLYSAPTFYGSSGGGVYAQQDGRWKLISISQGVWVRTGGVGEKIVITHLGRGARPAVVLEFLKGASDVR